MARDVYPSCKIYVRTCRVCRRPFIGRSSTAVACADPECKRLSRIMIMRANRASACAECGKPVWTSPSSRPEPVCHECRRKHPPAPRLRWAPQVLACTVCGDMFKQSDPRQKKYCLDCRDRARGHGVRACENCGKTYFPAHSDQRACGRDCGVILRYGSVRRTKQPKPQERRQCDVCDNWFLAKSKRQKRCSRDCTMEGSKRSILERYRNDAEFRDLVISRAHNRHARQLGLKSITSPATLTAYLMERDHARCGKCHKLIKAKKGPRRPSIGHIIPLSRGGEHKLENLQAEHLDCNLRANASGDGGQLLLVG